MSADVVPASSALLTKYLRDLNRVQDSDRSTRKRGLQKLLDDLPWTSKNQRADLRDFLKKELIGRLIVAICDPVEKCRELSLKLVRKTIDLCTSIKLDLFLELTCALCARINDSPFPEPAEELRLQVVEILAAIVHHKAISKSKASSSSSISSTSSSTASFADTATAAAIGKEGDGDGVDEEAPLGTIDSKAAHPIIDAILYAMSKSLVDSFPSVKRVDAELITTVCEKARSDFRISTAVKKHWKAVLKGGLLVNAQHQHSKTRSLSLQAIAAGIGIMDNEEEYASVMKDSVLTVFQKLESDRTGGVKSTLADACSSILSSRLLKKYSSISRAAGCARRDNIDGKTGKESEFVMAVEEETTDDAVLATDVLAASAPAPLELLAADVELVSTILRLCGDQDFQEVNGHARRALQVAVLYWIPVSDSVSAGEHSVVSDDNTGAAEAAAVVPSFAQNADIVDGELALAPSSLPPAPPSAASIVEPLFKPPSSRSGDRVGDFLADNISAIMEVMLIGVDSWSIQVKTRYLQGVDQLLLLSPVCTIQGSLLARVLTSLGAQLREQDEPVVRLAAEHACETLGARCEVQELLEILIPRVSGVNSGGDTCSQRMSALRVLTHVLRGFHHVCNSPSVVCAAAPDSISGGVDAAVARKTNAMEMATDVDTNNNRNSEAAQAAEIASVVSTVLVDNSLYEFREASMREAILLLVRNIISLYPQACSSLTTETESGLLSEGAQRQQQYAGVGKGTGFGCSPRNALQRNVTLSLIYLCGRCPGEEDVVPDVAMKELTKIARLCAYGPPVIDTTANATAAATTAGAGANARAGAVSGVDGEDENMTERIIANLLSAHYDFALSTLLERPMIVHTASQNNNNNKNNSSSGNSGSKGSDSDGGMHIVEVIPQWESASHHKSAFEVLVRHCPRGTWERHETAGITNLFHRLTQPAVNPTPHSAEANALSYASQRGEEVIPVSSLSLVDVRLSLLALLEGLIRSGAQDWECGAYLGAASERIIAEILIPNMIWRVGRVEATVRKVALAACFAILKAGAVAPQEALFKTASNLVPLLVSCLDDMEVTPRQMSCLCLTVLFERLRGAFWEQSIREIYPKLLARLDDSNDNVRVISCRCLEMFLQAGAPKSIAYSSTMIDYTLDQLFVHLDDPDPTIQEAVFQVILIVAEFLDKQRVVKKAEQNKDSHRTPVLCNRVLFEVTGIEILEDGDG